MTILALDGALDGFSCALLRGDRIEVATLGAQSALEAGLESAARLLEGAGLRPRDLTGVAVGLGPGSFTGVRIALSYAKALAQGAGLGICGVSSYDVLEAADVVLPALAVVSGRPGVICVRLRLPGEELQKCGQTPDVLDAVAERVTGTLEVTGAPKDVLDALGERGMSTRNRAARESVPAVAIAKIARERGFQANIHALAPDYGELPAVTIRSNASNSTSTPQDQGIPLDS